MAAIRDHWRPPRQRLGDYGYVVGIPRDTPFGVQVRWVAGPYSDEFPDGIGVVRAGDLGAFMGFDGPGSNEGILRFPAVGTFVFDADAVEVTPIAARGTVALAGQRVRTMHVKRPECELLGPATATDRRAAGRIRCRGCSMSSWSSTRRTGRVARGGPRQRRSRRAVIQSDGYHPSRRSQ
jgi:hypothetical protein